MANDELIKASLLALLPEGSIWVPAPAEDFDLLLNALAQNWQIVAGFSESVGDVRDPKKTEQLDELEREFGVPDQALAEEIRRQQLTAVKYENTQGNGSYTYVQQFLNEAGFDVQIHHNDPSVDPALFPGEILVNGRISYTAPAYEMQCNGLNAFCGNNNAVCGFFTIYYTTDIIYDLPTDQEAWPFIFFVGGDATRGVGGELTSIAPAEVPIERKQRFKELILKAKPWFDWAILIINYMYTIDSVPGLKLDLNALNWTTSITKDGADRISEFRDESGQNNHASQSVTAAQPVFFLTAINGNPGVRFDGSDDFFELLDALPNDRDFTAYIVVGIPTPITSSPESPGQILCAAQSSSSEPRAGFGFGSNSGSITGETFTFTAVETTTPSFKVSFGYLAEDIPAGVYVIKAKLDGTSFSIAFNGVSKTVGVFNQGGGTFSEQRSFKNINRIGANVDLLPGFLDADLGRFLYWDRALTVNEDAIVTDILIDEWS